jgi:hypothetical protein
VCASGEKCESHRPQTMGGEILNAVAVWGHGIRHTWRAKLDLAFVLVEIASQLVPVAVVNERGCLHMALNQVVIAMGRVSY